MMVFRELKSSVKTILANGADGDFRVIGHSGQARADSELLGDNRTVQVYFSRGDFEENRNSNIVGPFGHDVTLTVELSVSQVSKLNLALITSETATAGQIAAAISSFQESSDLADDSLDELADLVWNILMDATNYDMGLSVGTAVNRWVKSIIKDDPLPRGQYVVLTGKMDLNVRVVEENTGEEPVYATGGFDVTVDIGEDDIEQTGVSITP